MSAGDRGDLRNALAVIGYACRFPGAPDAEAFWANLRDGVSSISTFTEEECLAAGADPRLVRHPRYVRAGAVLDDVDRFDAGLFGFTPREARLLDPQHRLLLECGWAALEHAGIDPAQEGGAIGVFAGSFLNAYLLGHLAPRPEVIEDAGWLSARILNDKDFLATRLSYLLDLRGPSVTVQTACSTSLVATHLACQSLLSYDCDVALSGGVAVQLPQRLGHLYEEGGIFSPDGACRVFDAEARGTVGGSGVGLVVLKRFEEAVEDGDVIHALVRGTAINNDGALKVGYTAPSIESQAEVIAAAQSLAQVEPESVSYVEAHGTGTALGDPIEVEALSHVFRARTGRRGFCALGSVKSNIGHLDAAAGVAGLIKTVLALEHGELPPSLGCERPNPAIGFEETPFHVNTALTPWPADGGPRRAGVSSFGVGGTNAHAVLEEAPERADSGPSRPWQLLVLSAATPEALDRRRRDLSRYLEERLGLDLADVAHTLRVGRRALRHRATLLARDGAEAASALGADAVARGEAERERPPVAFLIPGQGAQRAGMGARLYDTEPAYREAVDRCAEILAPALGRDPRSFLLDPEPEAAEALRDTTLAQPALFVTAWALARLWAGWGVEPHAVLGHSLGELVAATLAGVFSLEGALALVAARGRLMAELPGGAMLSVSLGEATVAELLGDELALAAVNDEALCTVSGPEPAITRLEQRLAARGVDHRRLVTSHAFHSPAVDPMLDPLRKVLDGIELSPPTRPVVSSLTGRYLSAEEATDPDYWVDQTRRTVRFGDALGTLLDGQDDLVLLEVGPGRALSGLARRRGAPAVASLDPAEDDESRAVLAALGALWRRGVEIEWRGFVRHETRRREVLPTYPFADTRYWIERAPVRPPATSLAGFETLRPEPAPAARTAAPGEGLIVTLPPPESAIDSSVASDPVAELATLRETLEGVERRARALAEGGTPCPRVVLVAPAPAEDDPLAQMRHHALSAWAAAPGGGRERRYAVVEDGASLGEDERTALLRPGAGPSRVVVRAGGHLDLDAPVAPAAGERPSGAHVEAPRTPMERRLAALWSRLLGVAVEDRKADFFVLGGHSLLATQAVSRIRDEIGVRLELEDLFRHPTPAGLAAAIEAGEAAPPAETSAAREGGAAEPPPGDDAPAPLSFAQRRFWLLDRLEPGNPAYNIPAAVRLRGRLDRDALERALDRVVARHDLLRARFVIGENGEPAQRMLPQGAPEARPALDRIDLSGLPVETRDRALERTLTAHARRPFDLSRLPLLRAALVRFGPEDHVLLLNLHHVVGDGWSMALVVRDLGRFYAASVDLRDTAPAPPPLPYVEHARAEAEFLEGSACRVQEAYWRERLAGELPVLELPADGSRGRRRPGGRRSGRCSRALPAGLAATLLEVGKREGATPFMTLLALVSVLLHRLGGIDDLVIGTPIAGRRLRATEDVVGLFLNTLALRLDLSGSPTFRQLLDRVVAVARGAYGNQDIPFERILDALAQDRALARDLDRPPVFQVLFNMLSYPVETVVRPELEIEPLPPRDIGAKLDLTIYASEWDGGYRLDWIYDADLFGRRRVETMLDQLDRLAAQVAADPDRPIAALDLRTADALPDPRAPLPPLPAEQAPPRVDAALRRRAEETPDAEAVRQGEVAWSYRELAERIGAIAEALRGAGLGAGERVAVGGAPGPTLVAAAAAVFEAGGVLVPFDPGLPDERVEAMLEVARAGVLLWAGKGAVPAPLARLHRIDLDADGLPPADAPRAQVSAPREAERQDGAYVFFTSGSTGRPKAILGNHRGLAHFLAWQRGALRTGPGDRVAQLTPLSFDPVLRDLFLPLTSGAAVVVPEVADRVSPAALWRWLAARRVTLLQAVPSLLESWLEDVPEAVALPDLRCLVSMGEALTGELVGRFRARFAGVDRVINLYGPTETTLARCWYEVPDPAPPGVQPLGWPLPQSQALVVRPGADPTGEPVLCGVGEPGEIVLRTPYRSSGYLGAPDEDRARFAPNPWRDDPDDVLFHTGDRGRYHPDGRIEFLGRLDQQLKIRGVRVEPAEVRQALLAVHGVAQAAVRVFRDGSAPPRLAAYVVPLPGRTLEAPALRAALVRKLAPAAVPESLTVLDELPRTHSGKIDHRRLPAPAAPEETPFRAPATPAERLLSELWGELLEGGPFGLDDDFFARGGDSLLAVQLGARLASRHAVELPLRAVFENPSLAALAARLEPALGGAEPVAAAIPTAAALTEAGAEAGAERYPLSYAQLRLWFLDQLAPGLSAYNLPTAWRLRGRLDRRALEDALGRVVARQSTLRTRFESPGGRALQAIEPEVVVTLPMDDLSDLPDEARGAELTARLRAEAEAPFDLSRAPLLRARLLCLAPDDHVLAVTLHHIVSDAWSIGLLVEELAELYAARVAGRPERLPELPVRYVDYAAWQRGWLEERRLREQVEHWRERLAGAPAVLALPTDRPRPQVQSLAGARIGFTLAASDLGGLPEIARSEGVTPFAVLFSVFEALLRRTSGQDDFVVGTPVANRSRTELEPLIGLFLNTLALRCPGGEPLSLRRAAARAQAVALDAYEHQDLPFEKLVDELEVPRDPSHGPIFQILFTLHNTPLPRVRLEGLELAHHPLPGHASKLDLTLDLRWTGDGLAGSFEYASALFDATTVRRLAERFGNLLRAAVADPDRPLAELPLLGAGERHQAVVEWNDTGVPAATEEGVVERVAAHARERGAVSALHWRGESWSYERLDGAAAALAARLSEAGVGRGDRVALLLDRSPALVVAILACWRAGAAYVPLDPSYPAARLTGMAEDSGVRLVVAPAELSAAPEVPAASAPVLWIGEDGTPEAVSGAAAASAGPDAGDPDATAYVIYTSGSTGRPKGVAIPHGAVVNFLRSMARRPGLGRDDRLLALTSPSFDISVLELFLPLWVGGEVEIADRATAGDPIALGRRLDAGRVTVAQATPSTWRMLVDAGWRPRPDLRVLIGGEALPEDLAAALRASGGQVWNLYGPTETTVWSAVARLDAGPVTLGRPIAGTAVHVLDAGLAPVGIGVPGEMYLSGAGLARGYLARPGLTAERFLPDPFGERPGARLYRVGDLVRQRPDGRLSYLGRTDDQVKVRGFRIELGEVETVLAGHPDLREVALRAWRPGGGGQRLVAYAVAGDSSAAPSVEALRGWLGERLPDHMTPAHFVFLDALPRTPNGKVDRRALPAPEGERPDLERPYVAPRDEAEEALAAIWSRLLEVDRVGALDNFFALGGDSILGVQMAFQAREAGLEVTPAEIFRYQTVEELAAAARPRPEGTGDAGSGAAEDRNDGEESLADFGWSAEEAEGILEKL